MSILFQGDVVIPINKMTLNGELFIPADTKGIIVFSHGSGSSRFSIRNRQVAKYLQERGFGTLLFDLLTEDEDQYYYNRFNIDLLAKRLVSATKWLESFPGAKESCICYFGASTGAASALKAAAELPQIKAVVSRGGRPDLAGEDLKNVQAATLLIVGSLDQDVLQLNRMAYSQMKCERRLEIVEGASHLFEEPGKLEVVAELACDWFEKFTATVHV
ncbi:MAG TPA: hydrolase [Mucilaginibacter sp.]|jgi:dienelactone hydrolase|nr:hydrolase [Mucilaginibacter sp.]